MENQSCIDFTNLNISKSICVGSFKMKYKNTTSLSSNEIQLNETKYDLKEGEYVNDGIKIIKFLFETHCANFYLAHVEEIQSDILIKSTQVKITEESIDTIDKVTESLQTIQSLMHSNIISYFNIDVSFKDESDIMTINISMEYFQGISLHQYLRNHNKKSRVIRGLPIQKVKSITKAILNGLTYLSNNNITHSELNPENVLINEKDLSQIKIINYALRMKKENTQNNPYYSSPELSYNKTINTKTDIWSLGAIVFELFTGKQPYSDKTPFNALCELAKYISPIEAADESIKNSIYDKPNRNLLNFLLQCFRGDNYIRPNASELLEHKFII